MDFDTSVAYIDTKIWSGEEKSQYLKAETATTRSKLQNSQVWMERVGIIRAQVHIIQKAQVAKNIYELEHKKSGTAVVFKAVKTNVLILWAPITSHEWLCHAIAMTYRRECVWTNRCETFIGINYLTNCITTPFKMNLKLRNRIKCSNTTSNDIKCNECFPSGYQEGPCCWLISNSLAGVSIFEPYATELLQGRAQWYLLTLWLR